MIKFHKNGHKSVSGITYFLWIFQHLFPCLFFFFCFSFLYAEDSLKIVNTSPVSITLPRIPIVEKNQLAEKWIKEYREPAKIYAQNILKSMDKKAVLLVLEDIPTLSLWMLKKENQLPPSLTVYDFDGVFFQSLPISQRGTLLDYSTSHSIEEIFQIRQSAELGTITGSQVPVYSSSKRDTGDLPGYTLIPSGMVYMFWKEGIAKPDYKKLIYEITPLDEYIEKYPSSEVRSMSSVTHYMLGVNYLQLKDRWARDSAKMEFQKSAALADEMKGIHIMLADNFLELHDFEDAFTSAQTAIQKRPNSAKSYFIIGNCYEEKKDFQKAIQSFNSVLQLDPKFADSVKVKERIEALKKKIH